MPKIKDSARQALVEERKSQILSAAAKVFAQKGFERATIADIAKEAGLAEGSIYNYFKNKADLLVSLPHQMMQPTIEAASAKIFQVNSAEPASPEATLMLVAHNVIGTMRKNVGLFRILLSAVPSLKPAAREKYMDQTVVYATSVLEAYLQKQVEQGIFRRDLNTHLTARSFIGMFLPFMILGDVLEIESARDFDYDELIESNVKIFLNGALDEKGRTNVSAPLTEGATLKRKAK